VTKKEARFSIIEELRDKHSLQWLFELAAVSAAGYYKWRKARLKSSKRKEEEQLLKEHILAIHRVRPYYGYLRITAQLRREGLRVNHKRVYRLMKELGVRSVIRVKRRFFGKQASVVNPNRLERNFQADKPLEKLVTDITFLRVVDTFYYLSAIMDLFNNEIVAWRVSLRNDLALVNGTVDQLIASHDLTECILHSDQGFQYTSKSYNKKLEAHGILGSHSRRGNCLDNACMESFFSHLKTESIYLQKPQTYEQLMNVLEAYILDYNNHRLQKKFNDRSPVEYRIAVAA
jgi:putative transposase